MTNKYVVFYGNAFADEGVARDLTAGADDGILLNLNKTTDARLISYCTAVKVSEAEYLYGTSEGNIGSDAVKRFHAVLMMCRCRFLLPRCCDMTSRVSFYQCGLLSQPQTHVNKRPQD